jgi:hypothetical protein
MVTYTVGLDLAQVADYSALAVAERSDPGPGTPALYAIRQLYRWPLGTAYPDVGTDLGLWLSRPPLSGCRLAVDQTGVGRAVVDLLRRLQLPATLTPVTITAGHNASRSPDGSCHVPKIDLVAVLQVLLSTGRLLIAPQLREAQTLARELKSFQVKVTAAANETFGAWREGQHDDLVLAAALACWAGERFPALGAGSIGTGGPTWAREPAGVWGDGDARRPDRGVFGS